MIATFRTCPSYDAPPFFDTFPAGIDATVDVQDGLVGIACLSPIRAQSRQVPSPAYLRTVSAARPRSIRLPRCRR